MNTKAGCSRSSLPLDLDNERTYLEWDRVINGIVASSLYLEEFIQ